MRGEFQYFMQFISKGFTTLEVFFIFGPQPPSKKMSFPLLNGTSNMSQNCQVNPIILRFQAMANVTKICWNSRNKCDVLGDLVPFVQFKKRENSHGGVLTLVLKLLLFHGCFSRFLNYTNGTKSRNAQRTTYELLIISGFLSNFLIKNFLL